jgi:hypothetical protein
VDYEPNLSENTCRSFDNQPVLFPGNSGHCGAAETCGDSDHVTGLRDHPVIRARIGNSPPYTMWDNCPKGISIELLDQIAKMVGFQINYFANCIRIPVSGFHYLMTGAHGCG